MADSNRVLKERDALLKLHQINRAMSLEPDMDRLLPLIMDQAVAFTRAERGFLILTNGGGLDVRVARNIGKEVIDHPLFKISRGIIDRAIDSGQPIVLDSAKDDVEFKMRGSVINLQLASVACLPLKWNGAIVGVLYLDNRFRKGLFEPGDMMLLELFADEAATAIAHTKLMAELAQKKQERVARLETELQKSKKGI
jgi:adenylate cyclase